jgi:uncharacterized protein (TIGR03435 family)
MARWSRSPACSWLLLALLGAPAAAQTPVRFEVASIRPHPENGDTRVGIEDSEGFVRISNLPVRNLIAIAYDVMPGNVAGPSWLERRRFDITAKPPEGYQRAQLPAALRSLLADRFELVARRETRDGRGFALRTLTDGHRLKESTGPRTFLTGRAGLIAGNGRPIADLVPLLSQNVSAPVIDETSLKGAYDLKLEWSEELSIFTALREQLGLRLEPITTPVETVVVTSIRETPTPD